MGRLAKTFIFVGLPADFLPTKAPAATPQQNPTAPTVISGDDANAKMDSISTLMMIINLILDSVDSVCLERERESLTE